MIGEYQPDTGGEAGDHRGQGQLGLLPVAQDHRQDGGAGHQEQQDKHALEGVFPQGVGQTGQRQLPEQEQTRRAVARAAHNGQQLQGHIGAAEGGAPVLRLPGQGGGTEEQGQQAADGQGDEGVGGGVVEQEQAGLEHDGPGQLPDAQGQTGGAQQQGQQGIESLSHCMGNLLGQGCRSVYNHFR